MDKIWFCPVCKTKYGRCNCDIEDYEQRIKELEFKLRHYEHPVRRCDKCHAQIIPRCKCGYQEILESSVDHEDVQKKIINSD